MSEESAIPARKPQEQATAQSTKHPAKQDAKQSAKPSVAAASTAKPVKRPAKQATQRPTKNAPKQSVQLDLDHADPALRREDTATRRAADLSTMKRLGSATQSDRASVRDLDQARRRRRSARKELKQAKREAIRRGLAIEPTDYLGEHHPRMRGWLHAGMFPLCVGATVTLICLAPTGVAKLACSLYAATSMMLFGISACLHLIHWHSRRKHDAMCAIDYSNIFLTIAGTNTPIALALPHRIIWPYLGIIWGLAIVGIVTHAVWKKGPDWFFTIIYCALGLAIAVLLPLLWHAPAAGPAVCWLIIAGGACYIAGAVCFALRKPILAPGWFEYHEVFHLGTLLGWSCHCVAVYLVILSPAL